MGTRADRALAEPRARAGVCYLTRLRPAPPWTGLFSLQTPKKFEEVKNA